MSQLRNSAGNVSYEEHVWKLLESSSDMGEWVGRSSEPWVSFFPPAYESKCQGWKIHVSAAACQGLRLLDAVVPILAEAQTAFKVVRDVDAHEMIVSSRVDRAAGGKVMTVYPSRLEKFTDLTLRLSEATASIPGPGVLSDIPYGESGTVSYRFGGFEANQSLNDEGSFEYSLVAPDGTRVKDERKPWPVVPTWIDLPLEDARRPRVVSEESRAQYVLLNGRFRVYEAIRHSYRGGVYRAVDTETSKRVIVKQARPFTGSDRRGNDARDWLAREGLALRQVEHLKCAPTAISEFQYQGDFFLVQELIEGKTLRAWAASYEDRTGGAPTVDDITRVMTALVEGLRRIHDLGFVLRDLNPSNVMVGDDLRVSFIDLEFMSKPGEEVRRIFTPGYSAPELTGGDAYGVCPGPEIDVYGAGMALFRLCTGIEPVFMTDASDGLRPTQERIRQFLDLSSGDAVGVGHFRRAVGAVTTDDPESRATLDEFASLICESPTSVPRGAEDSAVREGDAGPRGRDESKLVLTELVSDGIRHLADSAAWTGNHLWPPLRAEGLVSDPLNVQSGAGGVLVFLNSVLASKAPGGVKASAAELASDAASWIAARIESEERILPGLYFGRSGTAWALAETASMLGVPSHLDVALRVLKRCPINWFSPDVTHGLAGLGLACLGVDRLSDDGVLRGRVTRVAERLAGSAEMTPDGIRWVTSNKDGAELAGAAHLGFAHGVAGVCYFLEKVQALVGAEGHDHILSASRELLLRSAMWQNGSALWPTGDPGTEDVGLSWWCSGSAGVGLYLASSGDWTSDEARACEGAAIAVYRQRWKQSSTACHGLASAGQFLLEMASRTGEAKYVDWAWKLADSIEARAGIRGAHKLIPGDDMMNPEYGYNTGMAGSLSFLTRLLYGGTMPLML